MLICEGFFIYLSLVNCAVLVASDIGSGVRFDSVGFVEIQTVEGV